MVDDRRIALGIARDHFAADVAAHVEGVAAEAADQGHDRARRRREHVEGVVALQAVDLDRLDVGEADRHAGAEDAVTGHDEGIGELGAQRDDRVEAGAAVDIERCIDIVLDPVVTVAGIELDLVLLRGGEGAHDEGVVAVLTFEAQISLVRVDLEGVVAGAAIDHGRDRDAAGQVAAEGQLRRLEDILGEETVGGVARGREDLADLEEVVTLAPIDGHLSRVVVEGEPIVALAAFDDDAPVDAHVVVDPLDHGIRRIGPVGVRVDERHEVPPQQELIRGVGAEDGQSIDATVGIAGIRDVDAVGRSAAQLDADGVAVLAAVDVERVGGGSGLAGERGQTIDIDRIRPVLAIDLGLAGQLADGDVEGVVARAEPDGRRRGPHPPAQDEVIAPAEAGQCQRRGGDGGAEQGQGIVARAEIHVDRVRRDGRALDRRPAIQGRIDDGVVAGSRGQAEPVPGRQRACEGDPVGAIAEGDGNRAGLQIEGVGDGLAGEAVIREDVGTRAGGHSEGAGDPVGSDEGQRVGPIAEIDREG